MGAKRKRDKISPSRVPEVLYTSVTERELARAVERGHLRGAKGETLALFDKRRSAKPRVGKGNGKSAVLRVAARAASRAGAAFYRGPKGSFEADRVPLSFVGCRRLPKTIKGIERIDAAGGIVVVGGDAPRVLLLFKGTEKSGRWVLPKGKRRRSEPRRSAARREVLEETGLEKVAVKKFLLRESYFDRERGKVIFKQVSYFLMRCPKDRSKIKPNLAEGFTRGRWLTFDSALGLTSPVRAHRPIRKARAGIKGA